MCDWNNAEILQIHWIRIPVFDFLIYFLQCIWRILMYWWCSGKWGWSFLDFFYRRSSIFWFYRYMQGSQMNFYDTLIMINWSIVKVRSGWREVRLGGILPPFSSKVNTRWNVFDLYFLIVFYNLFFRIIIK